MNDLMNLSNYIRDISDYPHQGVVYKDITPLLQDKTAFKFTVDSFVEHYNSQNIDLVLGIEARGFLLASAIAYSLSAGLIIARKPGKLPYEVISNDYKTEYSKDTLQIHKDSILTNQKVLIIDDVLATGGTANAAYHLVQKLGGIVTGYGFLIELGFINGRANLSPAPIYSIVNY